VRGGVGGVERGQFFVFRIVCCEQLFAVLQGKKIAIIVR
jgi:hypothetical protein